MLTTVPAGSRQPPISAGAVTLRASRSDDGLGAFSAEDGSRVRRTADGSPGYLALDFRAWAIPTTSGQEGGGGCRDRPAAA